MVNNMNITFMGVNVDDVFVETRYTRRFGKKKKKKFLKSLLPKIALNNTNTVVWRWKDATFFIC